MSVRYVVKASGGRNKEDFTAALGASESEALGVAERDAINSGNALVPVHLG